MLTRFSANSLQSSPVSAADGSDQELVFVRNMVSYEETAPSLLDLGF